MSMNSWVDIILDSPSPSNAWENIFSKLFEISKSCNSPVSLHNQTVAPDRMLAETAWELWASYPNAALRTSVQLKKLCSEYSNMGCAVLILDALSLRELPFLLNGAKKRNISLSWDITGSEAPSDTDQFAHALGVPSRSHFSGNRAPGTFNLFPSKVYTDVFSMPFEDCIELIPHETNIFIWHSWLDDLIHVHKKLPDQIYRNAEITLQSDGFWDFANRLRQGRKLLITSDHGYAVSKLFSSEEIDPDIIGILRETFGASRYKKASAPWRESFMPPIVVSHNEHHIVMGQRKWSIQGGFPHVCHGGLSLLEVAVPFIEIPPF